MLNDMTWRKLPRDLLTNENMQYIESCLPSSLAAAPYMFYMAALRQADDDGIFDLEDGVIFCRLMKIGTRKDLFHIANLMQQRHIITRVSAESNKCFLCDWDYPKTDKNKPRTMAERRAIVLRKIDEEKKQHVAAVNNFTQTDIKNAETEINVINFDNSATTEEIIDVDFSSNPAAANSFFCPDVDKNQKNVVKENQTEREIERIDNKRGEKNTQKEAADYGAIPNVAPSPAAEDTAVAEIQKQESSEQSTNSERAGAAPDAEYLSQTVMQCDEGGERKDVQSILTDFFVKNCYGYKENAGRNAINELAQRITELSNEVNPPDVVANVFCNEFKKMSDTPKQHWEGTPLLPAYMKKPGIWAHLLQKAGKILASNTAVRTKFLDQAAKYQAEYEAERDAIGDAFDEQYLKYGIDPEDPNRVIKLQIARRNAAGV